MHIPDYKNLTIVLNHDILWSYLIIGCAGAFIKSAPTVNSLKWRGSFESTEYSLYSMYSRG